jgi:L-cysteine S-thiosulfotransferase
MKRVTLAGLLGLTALAAAGCAGPRSSAGFRLPPGDAARGQAAFVELGCTQCHEVAGLELARPSAHPPLTVALGGQIQYVKTDGDLAGSIVYPSYRLADGYPLDYVAKDGRSRMPDHGQITVEQTADLVAFLQTRYEYVPPMGGGAY